MNECICDEGCMEAPASLGAGLQVSVWLEASTDQCLRQNLSVLGCVCGGAGTRFSHHTSLCCCRCGSRHCGPLPCPPSSLREEGVADKGNHVVSLSSVELSSKHQTLSLDKLLPHRSSVLPSGLLLGTEQGADG